MGGTWLPPALTQMAREADTLFYVMLAVVTVFFVIVEVLLVTFLIRYRRSRQRQVGVAVHGNNKLEVVWTLIPAVILVLMGAFGVKYVYAVQNPPANSYVVHVTGHEWFWEVEYPNGVKVQNDFAIPAGVPVLFDITSQDVIHGFYIPAVRLQQDAVPGHLTQFYVTADPKDIGQTLPVPCDQFCGQGHPTMVGSMKVLSQADFDAWLQQQKEKSQ
ncbi:MAG: cytochrome c oxidase subunit II [Thermoflavifilum sp.]|nr:cytochrome c oxidase subunit II [Thermoflavifilum sp.]MCL6514349.1 cytochrome c oxidase subunit II [Alicyclobacillus sp.]